MLALTLAVCLPCIAAEAAAPAAKRGVLRVKLQPELARQVGTNNRSNYNYHTGNHCPHN